MNASKTNPIKKRDVLKIYTDGASRGNPGHAACAFIFVKDNDIFYSDKHDLGDRITNNEAEYKAIIKALEKAVEYTGWQVEIYSDSELVINQINGEWRIKKNHLKDLYSQIITEKEKFKEVKFFYVRRENKFIKEADKLCNECLDKI